MRPPFKPRAVAMARADGSERAGGAAPTEPSLADGTGEGNAPIDGTSASSDPQVLAGTQQDPNATSLNDDDYPEDIAEGIADAAGLDKDAGAGLSSRGQQGESDEAAPADATPGADAGGKRAAAGTGNGQ